MRGKTLRRSVFETIALLLAHAEARLTFALTRQAYRRLGWNPRLVRFNLIPAIYDLRDVQERYANYVNAFGDMNAVVEAYIEDIREQYRIAQRDLVAHGSTDARQSRAAHHELAAASPFALILSSTRSARPSKDERGHAHARGPPLHLTLNRKSPNSQASPARSHRHA